MNSATRLNDSNFFDEQLSSVHRGAKMARERRQENKKKMKWMEKKMQLSKQKNLLEREKRRTFYNSKNDWFEVEKAKFIEIERDGEERLKNERSILFNGLGQVREKVQQFHNFMADMPTEESQIQALSEVLSVGYFVTKSLNLNIDDAKYRKRNAII